MESICGVAEVRIPKSLANNFLEADVVGDVDLGTVTLVIFTGESGKSECGKPGEYFQFMSNIKLSKELLRAVVNGDPAADDKSVYTYRLEFVIPTNAFEAFALLCLQLLNNHIYEFEIANLNVVEGSDDPNKLLERVSEMVINQNSFIDTSIEFRKCRRGS